MYGLDSDLIMLSLFHCKFFENIYIFRETPVFGKQFFPCITEEQKNECHFMNMNSLKSAILDQFSCTFKTSIRIYDYVFMCFFLGNDFLPHFPSLNIRTHGIETLLSTYNQLFGSNKQSAFINDSLQIQWNNVHNFIYKLAKYETERIIGETNAREKFTNSK